MTLAKDATAKVGKTTTGFDAPLVTEASRVLVFLLFAGVAAAQYHPARPMRPFPIAAPPPATAVPATAAEVPSPVPAQPVPAPPPSEKRPTVATRI